MGETPGFTAASGLLVVAAVAAGCFQGAAASTVSAFTAGIAATTTLASPAGLQACLGSLGVAPSVPQLVDLATYEGKPVAVIVLPAPAGVGRQVWVVSRTCAGTQDGLAYYGVLN